MLALGLALSVLGTAQAAINPSKSSYDGRIQHVEYNPEDVVVVKAALDAMTTIIFAPGETAKHFGSGFTNGWEFSAQENYFFIKPTNKEAYTNITVATNFGRLYQFDVRIVGRKNATYSLQFEYPSDNLAQDDKEREYNELMHRLSRTPNLGGYDVSQDGKRIIKTPQGVRNYNYTMNFGEDAGSQYIKPTRVYDDARFTYFNFNPNAEIPNFYLKNADGSEQLVRHHVEEDGTIAVQAVAPEFRLRAGNAVVGVYNDNYKYFIEKRTPPIDDHNTTVSGVKRVDINE